MFTPQKENEQNINITEAELNQRGNLKWTSTQVWQIGNQHSGG